MTKSNQRIPKVAHYVWINNRHVLELVDSLNFAGISAFKSRLIMPKVIFHIFLGPIVPIWYRLCGVQIIHLHWIAGQFKPARITNTSARQIFFLWYRAFFAACKLVNLKIVWTAHNFLPHESVFKDDFLARKLLVENCDTVIALNQEICELIRDSFHPKRISLIPAAEPGLKHRPDREAVRSRLGIPNSKLHFCALGHVRPYKGPDIYLKSLLNHVSKNRFSLAGSTNDDHYESEIIELGKRLTASGIDLDLQIKFLSDLELEEYLVASDFLVCPFRQISNSGIINLALENGIPLVLPDLPSLNWVPRESAIWYQAESAELGLSNAISEAEKLTFEARESMALAGQEFMQFRGWDNYVARHIEIYQDLIQ